MQHITTATEVMSWRSVWWLGLERTNWASRNTWWVIGHRLIRADLIRWKVLGFHPVRCLESKFFPGSAGGPPALSAKREKESSVLRTLLWAGRPRSQGSASSLPAINLGFDARDLAACLRINLRSPILNHSLSEIID